MKIKLNGKWKIKIKKHPDDKDARIVTVYKGKQVFEDVVCRKDDVINYIVQYNYISCSDNS